MYTFINTKDLTLDLRMYLPIMVDLLMESTVICDGIKIHYTDIIAELEKDLIQWNANIGLLSPSRFICGSFSSVLSLFFKVIIIINYIITKIQIIIIVQFLEKRITKVW